MTRDALQALVERARGVVVLGDIVLSDPELQSLCSMLRSSLQFGMGHIEEGALAIAAVNCLRDQPDDSGFRAYFCNLLRSDLSEWQTSFGPAIERFCVRTFDDVRCVGRPYRYVSLVWQHAGLRPRDVPQVAERLRHLAHSAGGWQGLLLHQARVTEQIANFHWPSRYLDQLMKRNGPSLCQHVLLLLVRINEGFATMEDVAPRYRKLIEALQARHDIIPTRAQTRESPPDPVVVWNENRGVLELVFDARWVSKGVYASDQLGLITTPSVPLEQPLPNYSGTVSYGQVHRTWGMIGWRRGTEVQYFRMTDGRRLSVGGGTSSARPPRQECYALSTDIDVLGAMILECVGRYRMGDRPVYLLRVQRSDTALEGGSPPELVWITPRLKQLRGACAGDVVVWNGVRPQLRILPADAYGLWRVMAEWDGVRRRLSCLPDGTIEMESPTGAVVHVWLEPQWEQRHETDPAARNVRFVQVPPVHLDFPDRLLAGGEPCIFTCGGDVKWSWQHATPLEAEHTYEVAPDHPLMEGSMTLQGGFVIPVVQPIHRAGIRPTDAARSTDGGVFWLDHYAADVLVTGWPEQQVRCRVTSPFGDAMEFNLPGRFDLCGKAVFSSVAWRERLHRVPPLVHVDVYGPRGWTATHCWVGLAQRIPEWLESHQDEIAIEDLPEEICTWLRPVAQLIAGALPSQIRGLPELFVPWVEDAYGKAARAAMERGEDLPPGMEQWAPAELRQKARVLHQRARVTSWTTWVHEHVDDLYDAAPTVGFGGILAQAAQRYVIAGRDGGTSRRSKQQLDRVYRDLCEGLPDSVEPQERVVAFVLAVLALWHRQGRQELQRTVRKLNAAVQPPELPDSIKRLCGLNVPVSDLTLTDLPVWPTDLSLEAEQESFI